MATHKSAEKRHRQSLKRRNRNRNARGKVKSAFKEVQDAIQAGDATKASALLKLAESSVASAAGKGIYHKKTAARKISRLARKANKISKTA